MAQPGSAFIAALAYPLDLVRSRVQMPVGIEIRAAIEVRKGADPEGRKIPARQLIEERVGIIDLTGVDEGRTPQNPFRKKAPADGLGQG